MLSSFTRALEDPLAGLPPLRQKFGLWLRMETWLAKGLPLMNYVRASGRQLDAAPLLASGQKAIRLTSWLERGKNLTELVHLAYTAYSIIPVEAKYLEWGWLQDVT